MINAIAVCDYVWLRRLHAVPSTCRGCRCGSSSNHANTDVDLSPHTRAVAFNCQVLLNKVDKRDLLVAVNLTTNHTLGNPMDLVRVVDHARLSWQLGTETLFLMLVVEVELGGQMLR